jgi:EmrB/QacA subfamily drug resistance transporter
MTAKPHSRWAILGAIMAGTFLGPLMASVVNIALPAISAEFRIDLTDAGWIALSFILTTSVTILTFSRIGDMIGHSKVFLWGQAIFLASTVLCGFANNFELLIIARVIQAIGYSMYVAVGGAIIIANVLPQERGRSLGIYGMTIAFGLIIGPAAGGMIIANLSWHWIFFASVPIAAFALIYGIIILPSEPPGPKQRFDLLGAFIISIALAALMLVLTNVNHWGWNSLQTVCLGILFIGCAVLFIMWEKRFPSPMIPLYMFRNRTFSGGNLAAIASFAAQFTAVLLLPFYLIDLLHKSPQDAGLILAASPIVSLVVSPLSGWFSDKVGTRFLSFAGMLIVAVGMLLATTLGLASPTWELILYLSIFGIGSSVFQSPNSSAVMGCLDKTCLGIGNGILSTTRNVGMAMGIALSTMLAVSGRDTYMSSHGAGADPNQALMEGLRLAFWVAGGISVLGALFSLWRGEPKDHEDLSPQTD